MGVDGRWECRLGGTEMEMEMGVLCLGGMGLTGGLEVWRRELGGGSLKRGSAVWLSEGGE